MQAATPVTFDAATDALRNCVVRPDVAVHEVPAPARVAPQAFALSAEVIAARDFASFSSSGSAGFDDEEATGDASVANGRFVVLHDPAGQEAWQGTLRVVVFARADLDDEMAGDPLLAGVAWSWLQEALAAHGAHHRASGGTVTMTASSRFGAMAGVPDVHEVELRCSWTPESEDLVPHLHAYVDLVASIAGLPPSVPGVVPLSTRRRA